MYVFRHGENVYRLYGKEYFIEYSQAVPPLQEMIRAKIFTEEIHPETGKLVDIVLFVERTIANDSYLFSADIGKEFPSIIGHNPDILVGKIPDDVIAMIICLNPEEIYPALAAPDSDIISFESKNKSKIICGHDFMLSKNPEDGDDDIFEDVIDTPIGMLDYMFGKKTFDEVYNGHRIDVVTDP